MPFFVFIENDLSSLYGLFSSSSFFSIFFFFFGNILFNLICLTLQVKKKKEKRKKEEQELRATLWQIFPAPKELKNTKNKSYSLILKGKKSMKTSIELIH